MLGSDKVIPSNELEKFTDKYVHDICIFPFCGFVNVFSELSPHICWDNRLPETHKVGQGGCQVHSIPPSICILCADCYITREDFLRYAQPACYEHIENLYNDT